MSETLNSTQNNFIASICIPSYNRPNELKRLLESINVKNILDLQIVICEDKSPKRSEVRNVVEEYQKKTSYIVKYVENSENLGHGKNLRECIKQADGDYIIFMGDDDMFIPGALDPYLLFIKKNKDCGYILRSYRQLLPNGSFEYFKYYDEDQFYEAGANAYTEFFLKSVFMSGFTIKRDFVKHFSTEVLDDTLLFQLYLMAEVCLKYPSAYCNTPVVQGVGDGISFFGTNKKEKDLYTPGKLVTNNLNFIKGFFRITEFIDNSYKLNSSKIIKYELSKYSFPLMSYSRGLGIKKFNAHCNKLKDLELDISIYFNLYYYALLIFGEKFCKKLILVIKLLYGRRIKL